MVTFVSNKAKHASIIQGSNCTLCKNLYINVHSSLIHNSPNQRQSSKRLSTGKRTVKVLAYFTPRFLSFHESDNWICYIIKSSLKTLNKLLDRKVLSLLNQI